MSGTPCGSCPRWVPESGSSIFCTLGGGSFQLVRLALDPKFTARDFLDLSSRITHLIGEFTVRVGSSVQEVSSHPPPPPPPPRQNSSQEGRGPPSSPPQRAQGITQAPRGQPGLETFPPPISSKHGKRLLNHQPLQSLHFHIQSRQLSCPLVRIPASTTCLSS